MPVSIKEIAQASGYSTQTVSRILNNKGVGHKKKTCDQVMKIAEELGYRPNALARAMVLGKFNAIGLLLSTNTGKSYLPDQLLTSIHDTLATKDMHLTLGRLPDSKLTDTEYVPKLMREWSCDGLLINYTDHAPEGMVDLITKSRLPSVWINAKMKKDCVHPDDFGGGKLATEFLISKGHRKIAYMNYRWGKDLSGAHYSVVERMEGYVAAMEEAGLPSRILQEDRKIIAPERLTKCKEWLRTKDAPTAVLTYSTAETIIVAAMELGIPWDEIPVIIPFSDHPLYLAGRPLYNANLSQYILGRRAVETLLEKIENPGVSIPPVAVPYTLRFGDQPAR